MTSLIGDNVASVVFDIAKSIDRVTITVYQAAAGEGILSWLQRVDKLISSLGNAIYFPYLAAVVIIGAIWLAWQGLIRKRGTRTIEGTIWMVVACVAAIWLIGRPADFTGLGRAVSNGMIQTLNTAFAKLPAPSQSNCLPGRPTTRRSSPPTSTSRRATGSSPRTPTNCGPCWSASPGWPASSAPRRSAPRPSADPGEHLRQAAAVGAGHRRQREAVDRPDPGQAGHLLGDRQQHPAEGPGIYPLFQGKQWTTRLEIAFAALFAAASLASWCC